MKKPLRGKIVDGRIRTVVPKDVEQMCWPQGYCALLSVEVLSLGSWIIPTSKYSAGLKTEHPKSGFIWKPNKSMFGFWIVGTYNTSSNHATLFSFQMVGSAGPDHLKSEHARLDSFIVYNNFFIKWSRLACSDFRCSVPTIPEPDKN
jgi:hypothetical protein